MAPSHFTTFAQLSRTYRPGQSALLQDLLQYKSIGTDTAIWVGDLDRAINDSDQAIQLNPNLVEAYINHGNVYLTKGDLDRSISDYNQAIQIRPNNTEAYLNRGIAYTNKGETVNAI